MKIHCPHCKHVYILDHPELRDKEICAKCNRVIFIHLLRKPLNTGTYSPVKRAIYIALTVILIGLTVFLTDLVNKKRTQEKLSIINQAHLEEINDLKEGFSREDTRKTEIISELEDVRSAIFRENKSFKAKLETQDIALSELVEIAKTRTEAPEKTAQVEEGNRPVDFLDTNLKKIVEDTLGIQNPTPKDMLTLSVLHGAKANISNLKGLEYAENLKEIDLSHNDIRNVGPLSGLINIKIMKLDNNKINSLEALSNLIDLQELYISYNPIQEAAVLGNFLKLQTLHIGGRPLSIDLSAIKDLSSLKILWAHSIPMQDISWLYELKNLEHLTLISCSICDINGIEVMRSLRYANLQHNNIKDPRPLLKLSKLETCHIDGNFPKDAVKKFIRKFNTIKSKRII